MTNYQQLDSYFDSLGYENSPIKKTIIEMFYVLDAQDLDNDSRRAVGQLISSVIENPAARIVDGVWEPFKLGETRKGAVVRVKKDAYDAPGGQKHNGLVGYLVDIRSGRCIVQYLGRSDGVGHYHPPHSIEVLKK